MNHRNHRSSSSKHLSSLPYNSMGTTPSSSTVSPMKLSPLSRRLGSNTAASAASFDRTIALNNHGASLMDRGDYHAAVKVLERAFFCFKKAYHLHRDSLESCMSGGGVSSNNAASTAAHSTHVDALFSWKKQRKVTSVPDEENAVPTKFTSNKDNDAQPSVYSNPIHLPLDFPVTQESCGFLSTSIALNLAVSHHLCGLELFELSPPVSSSFSKQQMQEHFAASGRLYEYTIRLESTRARQYQQQQQHHQDAQAVSAAMDAQQEAMTSDATTSSNTSSPMTPPTAAPASSSAATVPTLFVSPFALMVILNNLGHVHALLGNKAMSDRYYQRLQSACMYLMARSRTRHVGSITSGDLQIFLHNVSLGLQLIHCHSAAAA